MGNISWRYRGIGRLWLFQDVEPNKFIKNVDKFLENIEDWIINEYVA